MPWNLLILPLLGGFLFQCYCYQFRFASQRFEGYRLLMHSAVYGVAFLIAARLLTLGFGAGLGWINESWSSALVAAIPFPYGGTALTAFLIGAVLPLLWNAWVPRSEAIRRAIEDSGDELLVLLYVAAVKSKPVFITLDTRKVYIGLILNAPNLEQEKRSVGLLPLRSGYRDKDTLKTEFKVFYESIYLNEGIDPQDFQVTVPMDRIVSAHFYSQNLYDQFFARQGVPEEKSEERPVIPDE